MSPRSCLVVDDSRVVRKLARGMLRRHGYEVREAENGALALASCRDAMPGCILLDWNMPVMNGLEVLVALRAEFGACAPPVLFCTTETDAGFIARALDCGASEYIMKPFDEEILLGKLARIGAA